MGTTSKADDAQDRDGAAGVVITPAMIAAGIQALADSAVPCSPYSVALYGEAVREILEAALAVGRQP